MDFPIISTEHPLILASTSPRRKRLLTQIGLPFHSMASGLYEERITTDPLAGSRLMAKKKALLVRSRTDRSWILGADTVVIVGNSLFGKPEDEEEAKHMLLLLSGTFHKVITGFCVLNPSGSVIHSEAVTTVVRFKKLTEEEVTSYIRTGEPFGKAGSYAIQGIGVFMVESIWGSYTNIVGLPLCALARALVSVGALESFPLPD